MNDYTAMNIIDGNDDDDDVQRRIDAWQQLINSGLAWTLPGRYGRMASDMIEEGVCIPA